MGEDCEKYTASCVLRTMSFVSRTRLRHPQICKSPPVRCVSNLLTCLEPVLGLQARSVSRCRFPKVIMGAGGTGHVFGALGTGSSEVILASLPLPLGDLYLRQLAVTRAYSSHHLGVAQWVFRTSRDRHSVNTNCATCLGQVAWGQCIAVTRPTCGVMWQ